MKDILLLHLMMVIPLLRHPLAILILLPVVIKGISTKAILLHRSRTKFTTMIIATRMTIPVVALSSVVGMNPLTINFFFPSQIDFFLSFIFLFFVYFISFWLGSSKHVFAFSILPSHSWLFSTLPYGFCLSFSIQGYICTIRLLSDCKYKNQGS